MRNYKPHEVRKAQYQQMVCSSCHQRYRDIRYFSKHGIELEPLSTEHPDYWVPSEDAINSCECNDPTKTRLIERAKRLRGTQFHYKARDRQNRGLSFIKYKPEPKKLGVIPDAATAVKVGYRRAMTETTERKLGEMSMWGCSFVLGSPEVDTTSPPESETTPDNDADSTDSTPDLATEPDDDASPMELDEHEDANETPKRALQLKTLSATMIISYVIVLSDIKDKSTFTNVQYMDKVFELESVKEIVNEMDEVHILTDNARELTSKQWATYCLDTLPDKFPDIKEWGDHKQPPKHSKDQTDRLFSYMKSIIEQLNLTPEGIDNDLENTARKMREANRLRNVARLHEGKEQIELTILTVHADDIKKT